MLYLLNLIYRAFDDLFFSQSLKAIIQSQKTDGKQKSLNCLYFYKMLTYVIFLTQVFFSK